MVIFASALAVRLVFLQWSHSQKKAFTRESFHFKCWPLVHHDETDQDKWPTDSKILMAERRREQGKERNSMCYGTEKRREEKRSGDTA